MGNLKNRLASFEWTSRKIIILTLSLGLIIVLLLSVFSGNTDVERLREDILGQYSYETIANKNNDLREEIKSYTEVRETWLEDTSFAEETVHVDEKNVIDMDGVLTVDESYGETERVVTLDNGQFVHYEVEVEETGLYRISLDYLIESNAIVAPEMNLYVNGETPYIEALNIIMYPLWERIERTDENRYDRYGDELLPYNDYVRRWQNMTLFDAGYFQETGLFVRLEEGVNDVVFEVENSPVSLGKITFGPSTDLPSYASYRATEPLDEGDEPVRLDLEAEAFTYKNALNVKATSVVSPDVSPYRFNRKFLNILDGYSFDDGGSAVTYVFEIDQAGYYEIALKYMQNFKDRIPSYRDILIDGVIPFAEFEGYPFHYTKSWKNEVLSHEGEVLSVYLSEGRHTLTLRVNSSAVREIKEAIEDLMQDITMLSLEIMKLTGGKKDEYRTWNLETYIPSIKEDLENMALRTLYTYYRINELNGKEEHYSADVNALMIAHDLLTELADKPDRIPENMTKLSEGSGSALQLIGTITPILIEQGIDFDKIHIYRNTEIEEPKSNVFVNLWDGVRRFFYSFFDERYQYREDDEAIIVWVKKSKGYVDIMQQMIDESFTEETGIRVQLALIREEQKLVLANSSGDLPDVAMNISSDFPYELALRGILTDMTTLEGFEDLSKSYNPQLFTPFIYEDGVYGMPDTLGASLLFYRTDIVRNLDLDIPESWDDVIDILPVLQNNGMNYYHTLSNINAFKRYESTAPFIYQHQGDFIDTSARFTTIDQEETIRALKFMTDLYRVYGLPLQIPSFYQHFRSGTLPIGIGDMNMYLQFKYAAPELAGKWGVALLPGVYDEETDTINRYVSNEVSANVMFNTSSDEKSDMAWDFIRWWSSADVQAQFTYNVQATLGETFLYMTANQDAFKDSSWPSDTKQMIIDQWEWLRIPQNSPGNYMIEREISNIWNKVVFDNVHVRSAIDDAIPEINRELQRKLREFDYVDAQGDIVRPLVLPTYDTVERWLKDEE